MGWTAKPRVEALGNIRSYESSSARAKQAMIPASALRGLTVSYLKPRVTALRASTLGVAVPRFQRLKTWLDEHALQGFHPILGLKIESKSFQSL